MTALHNTYLEDKLDFAEGITRAMASGVQQWTIRLGTRWFAKNISIHGQIAVVDETIHCKVIGAPLHVLLLKGFEYMSQVVATLRKLYPEAHEINYETDVTLVKYHIIVPFKGE